MYAAGAFYVSEIRPSKILVTVDKNAMNENDTVEDNLKLWLRKQEVSEVEIKNIIEIVRPMIAQVSASLPQGKLTGIFEPLSLEVKNYRSYRKESFDFTKVSFATVNGPNGIGKSSFFMDAIADCLYEEPREGELTGWISNNEDARSGAITFEFLMGTDKWRVIRTRAKSGKATLALQKWIDVLKQWKDYSGDKKDHTQVKIVNLLGMDSMTFKSCALIMQDNYGVFLEADKTERMGVLGNILGLGIYDKLHALSKEVLKNQNRKVETLKNHISDLDEKLGCHVLYEDELKDAKAEKEIALQNLDEAEMEQKKAKDQHELFSKLIRELDDVTEKISTITHEISTCNIETSKLFANKIYAEKILNQEETILTNVKEYEKCKEQITVMELKIPLLKQKQFELFDKTAEKDENVNEKFRADKIICQEDKILSKIKEYEEAKTNIAILKAQQPVLIQKKVDLEKINLDIHTFQNTINRETEVIDNLNNELKSKDELQKRVASIPDYEAKIGEFEKLKEQLEELSKNENTLRIESMNIETEYERKLNIINFHITVCKEKAELIENSNCPIDNPSCSFLSDALEAKNKLSGLKIERSELDCFGVSKAKKAYYEATKACDEFAYNAEGHENLKRMIEILKRDKIKLATLSGKDGLLQNHLQQKAEHQKNLGELQTNKLKLEPEINLIEVEMADLKDLEKSMPSLENWYKGKDELPKAKQQLITINENITKLDLEIITLESEIKVMKNDTSKISESKLTMENLKTWVERKDEIPKAKQLFASANERLSVLILEIKDKTGKLDTLKNNKTNLTAQARENAITYDKVVSWNVRVRDANDKMTKIEIEIGIISSKLKELEKYEIEKTEKVTEIEVEASKSVQLSLLVKGFSIDGVPFQIVRSVVPELSAQGNDILGQMTGGKMSIEMKMDKVLKNKNEVNALEIWINDYQRGTMPYLSRSGGQKVKAALSVAFALANLKANRAGIQLGMMFIDEPPFLDSEGVQAYCDALELMHDRYPDMRVVAITHDEAMKARFPQNIDVIDTGDQGSKIVFNI